MCSAGVPGSLVEAIQRGGRGGRRPGSFSLFIIFYEAWVREISLDDFTKGNMDDPDRTRVVPLPAKATKKERAPYSSIKCVQCCTCLRAFFACELNDTATDGAYLNSLLNVAHQSNRCTPISFGL